MAEALRGNLADFEMSDVFQLISQQRKTGVLEVETESGRLRVDFEGGAVLSAAPLGAHEHAFLGEFLLRCGLLKSSQLAALEEQRRKTLHTLPQQILAEGSVESAVLVELVELLTEDTLFTLLQEKRGSFVFRAQVVAPAVEGLTPLPAEHVLMDGLRKLDEWQTFAEQVPSEHSVFRRTGSFEEYWDDAQGEGDEKANEKAVELCRQRAERLFQRIDGRLPVRRAIDLARTGNFEGMRLLAAFRRAGVIAPLERTPRRARAAGLVGGRVFQERVRRTALVLFPVLWFALVAGLALFSTRAAFEISALEEARDVFGVLRVRNAIDAYRFSEGEWPRDLVALQRRGLLPADALTAENGRAYYYERFDDGVRVLAPAH